MKKLINTALIYFIAAMFMGVFYREFTKIYSYTGNTMLTGIHTHLMSLGVFLHLILAAFSFNYNISGDKWFKTFFLTYNISLVWTTLLMLIRGIIQVIGVQISSGLDASVSGIAGIGHIGMTVGLAFMFVILKNMVKAQEQK